MSEELEGQEGQESQVEDQQPDPIEEEARSFGWKPKEDFEQDPKNAGKKWRTAEDFMDRKSLFDKIEAVSSENKQVKKALQQLGQHYTNVEKEAFKKALATLKDERKTALEEGNLVRAEEIRDEMDEVKEKINSVAPPVNVQQGPPPEFIEFTQRNTWYKRDDVMTRYADSLGNELLAQGLSPDRILKQVEEKVRGAFPEKFRNPNRDDAPEMVSSAKKAGGGKGFRLTVDEERVITNFIKSGVPITREQYIADLKKLRGNEND